MFDRLLAAGLSLERVEHKTGSVPGTPRSPALL
jgi:hypothetical protein